MRSSLRRLGQWSYFDRQFGHPDWSGKTVLDFGGNQGNLLRDSNGKIRPRDYYCVDVIQDAVTAGREQFPQAHFLHYNRYNCSFNPEGLMDEPIPDMGIAFDIIVAFSVFTHTTREEMHDLVGELETRLNPGGTLAFTFMDPHWCWRSAEYEGNNLQWRLERTHEADPSVNVAALLHKSRSAAWCSLVNGNQLYVNDNGIGGDAMENLMTHHVYYTSQFVQKEFPHATINPPVNGERHHCCIVKRPA